MASEFRIVGPPGCGKTTEVAGQVRAAAGYYSPDRVMVTSLTKAAAAEASGRDLPIPRHHVSTLHAHALHALGRPALAETREGIESWNSTVIAEQWGDELLMSVPATRDGSKSEPEKDDSATLFDESRERRDGDDTMAQLARYRAQLTRPPWPAHVTYFAKRWEEWKESVDRRDWTDLIEDASVENPPFEVDAIFVDEAQDLDRLEMQLIRHWADSARSLVVVGDADQCLYEWRGSDPRVMHTPAIDLARQRTLDQSYRVPRAVHAAAVDWIRQVENRVDPVYKPRDDDGWVSHYSADPDEIVEAATAHALGGKRVMILASCSYMLEDYKAELRSVGVPFHNPYRRRRGDWNPLYAPEGRTSAKDRLLAFKRFDRATWGDDARFWTPMDVWKWCEWMDADRWMVHGAKAAIKRMLATDEALPDLTSSDLMEWFQPEAVAAAFRGDAEWWQGSLLEAHRRKVNYPARVLSNFGADTLREDPRIVLGTIHSVKGGEADIVYVLPDLSYNADEDRQADPDPTYRLFYVAMTRAREELYLCEPSSAHAVDWLPLPT